MKPMIRFLFSIFFSIAIGVHIYYLIERDNQSVAWHCLYFITYGTCWWLIFKPYRFRSWLYALMALFPFGTHFYYGYLHLHKLDGMFWICTLVCVLLPVGFVYLHFFDATNLRNEDV